MPTHDHVDPSFSEQVNYSGSGPLVPEEEIIRRAVIRLSGHLLGFVLGTVGALLIFAATNWLVLKGGDVVGPHLGLLDQFLVGYSVSFAGSLVGAGYAFAGGYLSGLFIAGIYNMIISVRSLNDHQ